ncbi:MAG: sulfatase family protein [Phycisphaerae bacterium]
MKRRTFIKAATSLGGAAVIRSARAADIRRSGRRPNILVFLTDDHGRWAQQPYGNPDVKTPNMSWLAEHGTKMTQAYTTCPVCSPARASFFTGRMPSQHGIQDWLLEPAHIYDDCLKGQTLISEPMKDAGYYTGLIGKWHCGATRFNKPGFDYWFSYWVWQYPHFGMQNFSIAGEHYQQYGNQSELLTDRVLEFLKKSRAGHRKHREPFFLFVSYTDTHSPHIQAPKHFVDYYNRQPLNWFKVPPFAPCHGQIAMPFDGVPHLASQQHARLAQYYGAVANIDYQVGRVLSALKKMGELDDTIVVYTGDHGLNGGHNGFWEKGNATVPQNFVDDSILISAIVSWRNGEVRRGVTNDAIVSHPDLFMTLLEVANAHPSQKTMETINSPGRSYLRQLRGEAVSDWRDSIICEYGNARMLRNNRFKLILRYPFQWVLAPNELYDLQNDPHERVNVYDKPEHREVISDMSRQIDAFFKVYTVPGNSGLDLENQPEPNPQTPWILMARRDSQWTIRNF